MAPGSAVAIGTMLVLGYSTATWFVHGERPTAEAVKRLGESLTRILAACLKRHPDRRSLKKNNHGAVEEAYGTLEQLAAGDATGQDLEDQGLASRDLTGLEDL